ncbi:GNAT family N-acetyltransferase [Streptomyces sp. NPDC050560]|uniref:GNAT family N-acetyltransferase n=1 Tax=Streptomyces sp. NPDC050560 TaxID=3365630 RepID=UPI0037AEB88B
MSDIDVTVVSVPPAAEISGRGLLLRPWRADSRADAETWMRGHQDPDFQRWNTPLRAIRTVDDARASLRSRVRDVLRGAAVAFCVSDGATGTALGHIGLNNIDPVVRSARVGYWVLPEARGGGVARRALALLSDWSFTDVGLFRVELGHALGHDASCRIAERCGYALEGTLRGAMFETGRRDAFRDCHLHARIATDPAPEPPTGGEFGGAAGSRGR